jgi:hypothetical protein
VDNPETFEKIKGRNDYQEESRTDCGIVWSANITNEIAEISRNDLSLLKQVTKNGNCLIPTRAINRTQNNTANAIYIQEWVSNSANAQKLSNEADIIVVERNYFGDTLTIMQFWKVRGKTVICIFDDAYDIMHPKNVSHNFWTTGEIKYNESTMDGSPVQLEGISGSEAVIKIGNNPVLVDAKKVNTVEKIAYMKPLPLDQFKWGLRIAKGVQVPSVNLQKDWSKYNPNIHYVHNFLDGEKYMNVSPLFPHDKNEIWIGWCGSLSHYASFFDSGLLEALKRVSAKNKNVRVLISGDKRIWDLLEVEKKIFQPFVPKEQWCPLLKSLDIGLAPLAGEYDKRRSWIKALEYMALKIPFMATNYPTYDELHDYGLMVENGALSWVDKLNEMIDNYPKYKEIAETTGYDFAMQQTSDANIEKVTLALYKNFIDMPYA